MDEISAPQGIPPADWEATPASVRLLLLTLLERVRDLEARLNQHSRNSSKPPSSDPPSAPPRPSKTSRGRKAGAQKGHSGATRDLAPPDQVTEIVPVYPSACPTCLTTLTRDLPDAAPIVRTQVWDIPPITPVITEYQHHTVCCPQCQSLVWDDQRPAAAPPGGYGPRATALVALLRGAYHQSERAVAELLESVCGLPLSLGSVARCCERVSSALEPVHSDIREVVQSQAVANVDETSWREGTKRGWLWTMVTGVATLFVVASSRGAVALSSVLGTQFTGIVGSDRAKAYNSLPIERRQLCWAHLLRNLNGLAEYGHPDSDWANEVLERIDTLFEHWYAFREGRLDRAGLAAALLPIQQALRKLFEQGRQKNWYRIQGISGELLAHWEGLWRFVTTEGVEPTNNAAERALRPAVLWRKRCFGTRSAEGSRFVERILTVTTTCRQQQRDTLSFLIDALEAHWAGQPAPTLVSPT